MRLVLVDDHVLVRQSIRAFLERAAVEVVGEASTGGEAVQLVMDVKPDVVVLDLHLPDISGIEVTRRVRRLCPDVHVIALTAYNERAYQQALQEAGAEAFVLKTAELSELLQVVNNVMVNKRDLAKPATNSAYPAATNHLTERELEVISCAARGWSNKQIGVHLDISDRTVQVHLQAIYQKLTVSNRTEAVLRALSLGIIKQAEN